MSEAQQVAKAKKTQVERTGGRQRGLSKLRVCRDAGVGNSYMCRYAPKAFGKRLPLTEKLIILLN
jgi:hypothetical protein